MPKKRTKANKIKVNNFRKVKKVPVVVKDEQTFRPNETHVVEDQAIGYPIKMIHQDLIKSLVLTILLVIILLAIFLYTKSH